MIKAMLTTVDNPFDPFDDYDNWYAFDDQMGYHSPSYLARIVVSSDELSEADQWLAIEEAIDRIISEHNNTVYKKVTREVSDSE